LAEIKSELEKLSAMSKTEKNEGKNKPVFVEVCYKRELGVNSQEFLAEAIKSLPENVDVVSWKIADSEKIFSSSFESFEAAEIKNLDDKEIFTQLILSKTGLSAESEEGKAALEKFLPLFMQMCD
jgi:hypothetical protein